MKKRILFLICILLLLLTGPVFRVGGFADGEHPITLTIVCDPEPELESDGTIEDMQFIIRNESDSDYTLTNAKLSGGYENDEKELSETYITIAAGSSKEFHLEEVPVSDAQLDQDVVYTLSWEEIETLYDEETEEETILSHPRQTSATVRINRFIVPELTVRASCDTAIVRSGESFIVKYTIRNDTDFDMTGIRLYDPEQSMQSIALNSDELASGRRMTVNVRYTMGNSDMVFRPSVEYVARRRNITTYAESRITVGSLSTELLISAEANVPTEQGTTFHISVKNNGNRPLTGIQVYDEINTPIDRPFDLAAGQRTVLNYTYKLPDAFDGIRTMRFHAVGKDALNVSVRADDTNSFRVTPYVEQGSVRLSLNATLQSPYFEDGKLYASILLEIRYSSDVRLHEAVLREMTNFGEIVSYPELRSGETYRYTQIYPLDGISELQFRVDAKDVLQQSYTSGTVKLDVSGLADQVVRKSDPVYVYTTNPYMQDLDAKYRGVLRVITIVGLSVSAFCALICIVLYCVELSIRRKLPSAFEEEMEAAMLATKRRMDDQLFSDAPTERFGYRAPIKLKNYGDLTDAEAKARREMYAKGLEADLLKEGARPARHAAKKKTPVRIDADGTRVLPTAKKPAGEDVRKAEPPIVTRPTGDTAPIRKPSARSDATVRIPVSPRPAPVRTEEPIATRPTAGKPVRKEEPIVTRPTDVRKAEPIVTRPTGDTAPIRKPSARSDATVRIPVSPRPAPARTEEPIVIRPTAGKPVRKEEPIVTRPTDVRKTEPIVIRPTGDKPVRGETTPAEKPKLRFSSGLRPPAAFGRSDQPDAGGEPVSPAPEVVKPNAPVADIPEPVAASPEPVVMIPPAAPEPVTETPVASEPIAAAPEASEPIAEASEPVAKTPVASEPIAAAPEASEPIAAASEPVIETPASPEPVIETPASPGATVETPASPEVIVAEPLPVVIIPPAAPEPVTETPEASEPIAAAPEASEPIGAAPEASEPIAAASELVIETPASPEPVIETPASPGATVETPASPEVIVAEPLPVVIIPPAAPEPVTETPEASEPIAAAPEASEPIVAAPEASEPIAAAPEPVIETPASPGPTTEPNKEEATFAEAFQEEKPAESIAAAATIPAAEEKPIVFPMPLFLKRRADRQAAAAARENAEEPQPSPVGDGDPAVPQPDDTVPPERCAEEPQPSPVGDGDPAVPQPDDTTPPEPCTEEPQPAPVGDGDPAVPQPDDTTMPDPCAEEPQPAIVGDGDPAVPQPDDTTPPDHCAKEPQPALVGDGEVAVPQPDNTTMPDPCAEEPQPALVGDGDPAVPQPDENAIPVMHDLTGDSEPVGADSIRPSDHAATEAAPFGLAPAKTDPLDAPPEEASDPLAEPPDMPETSIVPDIPQTETETPPSEIPAPEQQPRGPRILCGQPTPARRATSYQNIKRMNG